MFVMEIICWCFGQMLEVKVFDVYTFRVAALFAFCELGKLSLPLERFSFLAARLLFGGTLVTHLNNESLFIAFPVLFVAFDCMLQSHERVQWRVT